MKWLMSKCLQFQKPYKCEVLGCTKRYTDPSSLRKHVKSHSVEEQQQYRRSKDLANMAKRSCSPTARYSSWTPSSSSSAVIAAVQKTREMKWKFIMYYYFTGIFWIFLWINTQQKIFIKFIYLVHYHYTGLFFYF